MKNLSLFLTFLVIGLVLSVITLKISANQSQNLISPNLRNITFDPIFPPKLSLTGRIATLSGNIKWQSRIATQAAAINTIQNIQQGESLQIGNTGNATVEFPNIINIALLPKTEVDFVQTLPVNLVINQPNGIADYLLQSETTLSIRSLHLLINPTQGETSVTVNPDQSLISLHIKSGSVTAAFNDTQNNSKVVNLKPGTYQFNDRTRQLK